MLACVAYTLFAIVIYLSSKTFCRALYVTMSRCQDILCEILRESLCAVPCQYLLPRDKSRSDKGLRACVAK